MNLCIESATHSAKERRQQWLRQVLPPERCWFNLSWYWGKEVGVCEVVIWTNAEAPSFTYRAHTSFIALVPHCCLNISLGDWARPLYQCLHHLCQRRVCDDRRQPFSLANLSKANYDPRSSWPAQVSTNCGGKVIDNVSISSIAW